MRGKYVDKEKLLAQIDKQIADLKMMTGKHDPQRRGGMIELKILKRHVMGRHLKPDTGE